MSGSTNPDRLMKRAEFLFLSSRDFWDVGICVDSLLGAPKPFAESKRVRLTLETGMLVTYARPFSGRGRTIHVSHDLSSDLRTFHDDIMRRRNQVYAHTDHTDRRQILEFRREELGKALERLLAATPVSEQWDSLTDAGLTALRELAAVHYRQCTNELRRLFLRIKTSRSETLK